MNWNFVFTAPILRGVLCMGAVDYFTTFSHQYLFFHLSETMESIFCSPNNTHWILIFFFLLTRLVSLYFTYHKYVSIVTPYPTLGQVFIFLFTLLLYSSHNKGGYK
jgi:hypothetical protein